MLCMFTDQSPEETSRIGISLLMEFLVRNINSFLKG